MQYFKNFLKSIHISQSFFYFFVFLILVSFGITFYLLLPNNDIVKDPKNLLILLSIDVIFVILLVGLLIRQIILIFINRGKKFDESRLYIKFVNLFTLMALGPAIGVVIITTLFFNLELRTWYGDAVKKAVVSSNIVARNYANEIQEELISDVQLITREIINVADNNEVKKNEMDKALQEYLKIRTISNIYLFDKNGKIFSSFNDKELKNFKFPNNSIFEILDKNQIYIFQPNENSISAYKKIIFFTNTYIQVNRNLNNNIWNHIKDTRRAFEIYTSKEEESTGIQITFSTIFVLFSICFILIAVLVGLQLASRLSNPISRLIESANQIAKGNFKSKVYEDEKFEEINVLIRSYNKMINEIHNNQNLLLSKSEEDEKKRLFIEAILSLLTTGIISLDNNLKVNLINKSALNILQKKHNEVININLLDIFPEWKDIFEKFVSSDHVFIQNQIEYNIGDNTRNFNFKIIKEINESISDSIIITGYVVTIDDMTSLILAEKHAAWSDIARKIAHEVKNPLTPIKLSAERIERKFKDNNFRESELTKLTKTISKQVDDIGKLVDEFSSFARLPKAEMKYDNFTETINECYALFSNAHSNINFNIELPNNNIFFNFDRFQIVQAFNNLIKNSIEAVSNIPNPSIKFLIKLKNNLLICSVIDNGIGIDNKNKRKLFEPYYTTKEKGTGLGLSIVKKIIEDHGGAIKIEKNTSLSGSTATIIFDL